MMRRRAAVVAAAALVAGGCRASGGEGAASQDSAASDSGAPAAMTSGDSASAPAAATPDASGAAGSPAASGSGSKASAAVPNGGTKSSGSTTPAPKRPVVTAGLPAGPAGTSPAPGVARPSGRTTPALVVFRDSVLDSDIAWLRAQGFTVENVNDAARAVSVGVPDGYSGDPKKNPRIVRFTIAMR